jgi:ABC-type transporter Mla maintaining outer membrane lipid asymmetry ATPase subunit MlaF
MSDAPTQQSTPEIEMSDVTVGTRNDPQVVVLEGVNWQVATGEYWIVGGMHNSGKSDFLAMIAGLAPPKKGTFRLFGKLMPRDIADQDRLRVGLVFDGGKPLHRLTVAENVLLPLRYHCALGAPASLARAGEILELTGLSSLADKMSGAIGRSWEKRLGLARALALRPELLLLDDPLGGLDSRHLNWWMAFMEKLRAGHPFLGNRPATLIVAAHNLRPWHSRSVSLAVLGHQRFVSLGHCKDLSSVKDPLVNELLHEEAVEVS